MRVASHPPIPIAGHRGASDFGEIAELGLLVSHELFALLFVDVATHSTYIFEIKSKRPGAVHGIRGLLSMALRNRSPRILVASFPQTGSRINVLTRTFALF